MTRRIAYTITPRDHVSAGASGQVQNSRRVYEVIPGSVIRGALGQAYWLSPQSRYTGPDAQSGFDTLFGRHLRVGFAIPQIDGHEAVLRPMTWLKCKYPDAPQCRYGWFTDAFRAASEGLLCHCGESSTRGRGWELPTTVVGADLAPKHLTWRTNSTRTALTAKRTAVDEKLFTRKAIRSAVSYTGVLDLPDSYAAPRHQIDWLTQSMAISVGGQRSTMGRCDWQATLIDESSPTLGASAQADRLLLARLRTPAILLDQFGAPSLDLARALRGIVGQNGRVDVRPGWTRPTSVGGWHGMSGLPKPIDWAVEAGSTALLTDWDADSLATLSEGLGVRRLEGYGVVEVVTQAHEEAHLTAASAVPARAERTHSGVLDDLRAGLRGDGLDKPTLRGLVGACRDIEQQRARAGDAFDLESAVADALDRPWARRLRSDSRAEARRLLREVDAGALAKSLDVALSAGAP